MTGEPTKEFSIYDATGRILAHLAGSTETVEVNIPEGCEALEGFYPASLYYVEDGRPALKQEMSVLVEKMSVTGLPIPCTAYCDGAAYTIPDGVFELTANLPGPYVVLFRAVKHKDKVVTLE